jgi:hypothetical protein
MKRKIEQIGRGAAIRYDINGHTVYGSRGQSKFTIKNVDGYDITKPSNRGYCIAYDADHCFPTRKSVVRFLLARKPDIIPDGCNSMNRRFDFGKLSAL